MESLFISSQPQTTCDCSPLIPDCSISSSHGGYFVCLTPAVHSLRTCPLPAAATVINGTIVLCVSAQWWWICAQCVQIIFYGLCWALASSYGGFKAQAQLGIMIVVIVDQLESSFNADDHMKLIWEVVPSQGSMSSTVPAVDHRKCILYISSPM